MAYINQTHKAELSPAIKAVFKKYNLKASISIQHHSTLIVKIVSSPIDFLKNYNETNEHKVRFEPAISYLPVNEYYIEENFSGVARDCLVELRNAMNTKNYNNSDLMTDYFDVGYYTNIKIGEYNKPYQVIG